MLEKINSPKDLKKLSINQLSEIAKEARELIIKTVAKTGGHLASSLGTVELTLALHYVFNAPKDKIIWDVGHQAYTHKIITGRKDKFATLRQYGGISGFPKRKESIYDTFDTGHSSTSVSLGSGVICARDFLNKDYNVIVVIGDGALSAGMAYEALNQIGHLQKDVIIVLNDNEMSINKSVGAISNYLNRIIITHSYNRLKKILDNIILMIPLAGQKILNLINRTEEVVKGYIVPGMLFEELGFRYIGPIDGHNLKNLIKIFERVKELKGRPILVHTITKKGKGYEQAEKFPTTFHGIGKFEIESGSPFLDKNRQTYTEIFGRTIVQLAKKDKKIIAITAAMAEGTGLSEFAKKFPKRFFDVGIAEQHAVTFAAALASQGFKPCVAIYSTFLQRAFDQIIHDVCLQKLPVKFFIDRAGIVGEDGETHNGTFDISYLRTLPNMVILAPKDENEFLDIIWTMMNYDKGPIAVRYPRGFGPGIKIKSGFKKLPIGKPEVISRGEDLLVLATGNGVRYVKEAANLLKEKSINITLLNCWTIKPLDEKTILRFAKKIPKILTVEENTLQGGFGSSVAELLHTHSLQFQLKMLGLPDKFIEHGSQDIIRKKYGISTENIYNTILRMVKN